MIYSIHIYSEFEAVIFENGICKAETNSKLGFHFDLNTEVNNNLFVYSAETFFGYKFIPYIINLNEIITKNNNNLVKVKKYVGLNKNVCEIILKTNLIPDTFSYPIKEKICNIDKRKYSVNVFADCVEINNSKFNYKSYFNFIDSTVQQFNNFIIVINSSKTKHYVIIFNTDNGIVDLCFEDIVDKIELNIKENKIKILKKHNYFYKTGKVEEYLLENQFVLKESYFVKMGNINKNLHTSLIPYAFLHCVILKDYNFAKNFLCSELKSKLSPTSIASYFENLVDFEKCKYCEDSSCIFVKYKNEDIYKPLKFMLSENKIVDMK